MLEKYVGKTVAISLQNLMLPLEAIGTLEYYEGTCSYESFYRLIVKGKEKNMSIDFIPTELVGVETAYTNTGNMPILVIKT